ncbi:hypothetical protein DRO54_09605 [Candidatus Bathyarchaeota archaeon]|nr:MAG: hypothetical protein DRO54_09605 [Candidatus Bathyarchaeota archaeon]
MTENFEPEIVVFYCGRSISGENYLSEGIKRSSGFKVRFIMLPCSSKVEPGDLIKLFERGIDGVVIVACPEDQCQFLVGSTRAASRIKFARTLLEEVGMGSDRLRLIHRNDLSAEKIMSLAEEQANVVRQLGQNPMKLTVPAAK